MVDKDYIFYTKTDKFGIVKNYGVSVEDFIAKKEGVEIVSEYAVSGNIIASLDKVCIHEEGMVYTDTLKKANQKADSKVLVAVCDSIGTMLFVEGDDLYYYNSSNQIARIELGNEDAKEVRVSEDTVTLTWYDPEIVTIGDKEYLFYCDNSNTGMSYVKYVDINAKVTEEDTDDDDEADKFYIEGAKLIGVVTADDKADIYEAKVSAYKSELKNNNLVFDTDDNGEYKLDNGKLQVSGIKELRKAYNDLEDAVKEKVEDSALNTLGKYEKAIEIANVLYKLNGIKNYEELSASEQTAIKTAYDSIKAEMKAYYQSEYKDIDALIKDDLKANYTKAVKLFENK